VAFNFFYIPNVTLKEGAPYTNCIFNYIVNEIGDDEYKTQLPSNCNSFQSDFLFSLKTKFFKAFFSLFKK